MFGEAKVRFSTEFDTEPITKARNEFSNLTNTIKGSKTTFDSAGKSFINASNSLNIVNERTRDLNFAFQDTVDIGDRVGNSLLNTTNSYDRLVELTDNFVIKNTQLGKSLDTVEKSLFPVADAYERIQEKSTPVQKTFELIQINSKTLNKSLDATVKTFDSLAEQLEKTGPAGEVTSDAIKAIRDQLKDVSWLIFAISKLEDFKDLVGLAGDSLEGLGDALGIAGASVGTALVSVNDFREGLGGVQEQLAVTATGASIFGKGLIKTFGEVVTGAFELTAIVSLFSQLSDAIKGTARQLTGFYEGLRLLQNLGLDTTIVGIRDQIGLFGEGLLFNFGLANDVLDLSVQRFAQLEQSLQFVRTISAGAELSIVQLGERIQQFVDGPMGNAISAIETTTALYNTLSAGIGTENLQEAFDFIEVAGKLATATGSSIETVSTALIFAGDTFEEEFGRVGALLKATVDQGQLTLNSLVNNLGRVSSTASALGTDIENTFAIIAAASQRLGTDSNIAVNALLNSLLNIGTEGQKVLDKYGVSLDKATIENVGLIDALNEAFKAMGNNTQELRKVIPETLAFSAALAVLQNDAKAATQAFDSFKEAGIEDIEELFEESQKTISERLGTIQNQFTGVFEKAGIAFKESGLVDQLIAPVEVFAQTLTKIPKPLLEVIGGVITFNLGLQKLSSTVLTLTTSLLGIVTTIGLIVAPFRLGAIAKGFTTAFGIGIKEGNNFKAVLDGLRGALKGLVFGSSAFTEAMVKQSAEIGKVAGETGKLAAEGSKLRALQDLILKQTFLNAGAKKAENEAIKENTVVTGINTQQKIANKVATDQQALSTANNAKAIVAETTATSKNSLSKLSNFFSELGKDMGKNFSPVLTAGAKFGKFLTKTLLPAVGKLALALGKIAVVAGAVVASLTLIADVIGAFRRAAGVDVYSKTAEEIKSIGESAEVSGGLLDKLARKHKNLGEEVKSNKESYEGLTANLVNFTGKGVQLALGGVKNLMTSVIALGGSLVALGARLIKVEGSFGMANKELFTVADAFKAADKEGKKAQETIENVGNFFRNLARDISSSWRAPIVEAFRELEQESDLFFTNLENRVASARLIRPEAVDDAIKTRKAIIEQLEIALEKRIEEGRLTELQINQQKEAIKDQNELLEKTIELREKINNLSLENIADPAQLDLAKETIKATFDALILDVDKEIAKFNEVLENKKLNENERALTEARKQQALERRKALLKEEEVSTRFAERISSIQRSRIEDTKVFIKTLTDTVKSADDTIDEILEKQKRENRQSVLSTQLLNESKENVQQFANETRNIIADAADQINNDFQEQALGTVVKNRQALQTAIAEAYAKENIDDVIDNLQEGTFKSLDSIGKLVREFPVDVAEANRMVLELLNTQVSGELGTLRNILSEEGGEALEQLLAKVQEIQNSAIEGLKESQDLAVVNLEISRRKGEATIEDLQKLQLENQKELLQASITSTEQLLDSLGEAVNSPRYQGLLKDLRDLQVQLFDLEIQEIENRIDRGVKRLTEKTEVALSQLDIEQQQETLITEELQQQVTIFNNLNELAEERQKFATDNLKRVQQFTASEENRLKIQTQITEIEQKQRESQISFSIRQEQFQQQSLELQKSSLEIERQRTKLQAEVAFKTAEAELQKLLLRKDVTEEEVNLAQAKLDIASLERDSLDNIFATKQKILNQEISLSREAEKNLNTQLKLAKRGGVLDKIISRYDTISARIKDMGKELDMADSLLDTNRELVELAQDLNIKGSDSKSIRSWMEQNASRQLSILKLRRELQDRLLVIEQNKEKAALRMQRIEIRNNALIAQRELMLAKVRGDYEGIALAQEQLAAVEEQQQILGVEERELGRRQEIERELQQREGVIDFAKQVTQLLDQLPKEQAKTEKKRLDALVKRELRESKKAEKMLMESAELDKRNNKEFIKNIDKSNKEANAKTREELGELVDTSVKTPIDRHIEITKELKNITEDIRNVIKGSDTVNAIENSSKNITDTFKEISSRQIDATNNFASKLITPDPDTGRSRIEEERELTAMLQETTDKAVSRLGEQVRNAGGRTTEIGDKFVELLNQFKKGEINTDKFREETKDLIKEAREQARQTDAFFADARERGLNIIPSNESQKQADALLKFVSATQANFKKITGLVEESRNKQDELRLLEKVATEAERAREEAQRQTITQQDLTRQQETSARNTIDSQKNTIAALERANNISVNNFQKNLDAMKGMISSPVAELLDNLKVDVMGGDLTREDMDNVARAVGDSLITLAPKIEELRNSIREGNSDNTDLLTKLETEFENNTLVQQMIHQLGTQQLLLNKSRNDFDQQMVTDQKTILNDISKGIESQAQSNKQDSANLKQIANLTERERGERRETLQTAGQPAIGDMVNLQMRQTEQNILETINNATRLNAPAMTSDSMKELNVSMENLSKSIKEQRPNSDVTLNASITVNEAEKGQDTANNINDQLLNLLNQVSTRQGNTGLT